MKKINSIHFGGEMLGIGVGLMIAIPGIAWLFAGNFYWFLLIPGAAVLMAFIIIFIIEMKQDNDEIPYYERQLKEKIPFDREHQIPIIQSSICTGEKIAGFKDKKTGHFTEVMVIRSDTEKERFMNIYGITEVHTEY